MSRLRVYTAIHAAAAMQVAAALAFAAPQHLTIEYERQPAVPGEFGPPDISNSGGCIGEALNPGKIDLIVPGGGVTVTTGLLLQIPGITPECESSEPFFYHPDSLADELDLVMVHVRMRNVERQPVDHVRYKLADMMRSLGRVLEEYPAIDRTRIYVFGASGGGTLAMQAYQLVPGWASVTATRSVVKLTTIADLADEYGDDYGTGWANIHGWSETMPDFARQQFYQSPLLNLDHIVVNGARYSAWKSPTLYYVDHGTADDAVAFAHFENYHAAVAQRVLGTDTFPQLVESDDRFDIYHSGNFTFVAAIGVDHTYDPNTTIAFITSTLGQHPFTVHHPTGLPDEIDISVVYGDTAMRFATNGGGLSSFEALPQETANAGNRPSWSVY